MSNINAVMSAYSALTEPGNVTAKSRTGKVLAMFDRTSSHIEVTFLDANLADAFEDALPPKSIIGEWNEGVNGEWHANLVLPIPTNSETLLSLIKGMEVGDDVWHAFTKSNKVRLVKCRTWVGVTFTDASEADDFGDYCKAQGITTVTKWFEDDRGFWCGDFAA